MPTAAISIADGQLASSEDAVGTARAVTNWMVDSQGFNRPRPGLTNGTLPFGSNGNSGVGTNIIGTYVWTNPVDRNDYLIYVVATRFIYALNLTSVVAIYQPVALSTALFTTQLDGTGRATFAEDGLRLVIAGGGNLQTWDGTVGSPSSRLASFVLATNQPPLGATHIVKLANYFVANNQYPGSLNQFIWSAIGDGNAAVWPPLNFNTADARPDPVVAVHDNLRELYIFGTQTLQVYGVTSDANLPFQSASTVQIGTVAPYSIVGMDTQFALLDSRRRFITTDGRSYQVISDAINKTLRDLGTVADCFGFRCLIGWWDLLVWVFPTAQIAFYFDNATQKWGTWKGWNGVDDFTGIRIGSYVFDQVRNRHIIGDSSFTNLFTLEQSARFDVAVSGARTLPIVAERITGRIDQGTSVRKRTNWIRFYVRRGAADANAAIEVSKRDDDGPWSTPQTIDLGVLVGDQTGWREWRPGGIYRRRQYRIRYSGSADTVLSGIEEDFAVMTS